MTDVFGYLRFSYFGRSDARLARTSDDEEQHFRALYSAERMAVRFHFFENVTLPSLRAQRDTDFQLLILASNAMPEVYKKRLETATADVRQIEILYSDARHVTDAINPWMEARLLGARRKTVHFRLDDDDAMCADMVSLLRDTIPRARRDELVTFPRGFYLTYHDGKPHLLRKFQPYIAIAWAFVNQPGQIRNPYQGNHGKHRTTVPSMMNPLPYAYIHVAHAASDTRARQGARFKEALAFDPNYSSERARARIARLIGAQFPALTLEKLEEIIDVSTV